MTGAARMARKISRAPSAAWPPCACRPRRGNAGRARRSPSCSRVGPAPPPTRASPPTTPHGPSAPPPAPSRPRTRTGPDAAAPPVHCHRSPPSPRPAPAPAQGLHERRLAAANCPDQAIAVPAADFHGEDREKGLGPELHGNAGGDDHWDSRNKKAGLSQLGLGPTARAPRSGLTARHAVHARSVGMAVMGED